MLAYLADVFQHLNDLDIQKRVNIVTACTCGVLSDRKCCYGVSLLCKRFSLILPY